MATIKSENFDGVPAPAIPSGWVADTNIVTETTSFQSSPNGVTSGNTTANTMFWDTNDDGNGGAAQASAWLHYGGSTSAVILYVFCRMTSVPTSLGGSVHFSGMTSYGVRINPSGNNLNVVKVVAGTVSNIGATRSHTFSAGDKFIAYCRCVGSSIILRLQRTSDGKWLDSSDTWQSTVQDTITASDTSVTGAGKSGLGFVRGAVPGDVIYADDFLFETIITRRRGTGSTFL